MKPGPLDQYAPWPDTAEDATAEALMRASLVRARAAIALWEADLDAPRQLAYALGHYATARLLHELIRLEESEIINIRAVDRMARNLWEDLADGGAVLDSIDARLALAGINADDVARSAVGAYERRSAVSRSGG